MCFKSLVSLTDADVLTSHSKCPLMLKCFYDYEDGYIVSCDEELVE